MTIDTTMTTLGLNQDIRSHFNQSDDVKLKEQTDSFESLILKQMLDMTIPKENSLFGKSTGSHIYQSMYNDTISKELSGGFGYSELLYNFLKENRK